MWTVSLYPFRLGLLALAVPTLDSRADPHGYYCILSVMLGDTIIMFVKMTNIGLELVHNLWVCWSLVAIILANYHNMYGSPIMVAVYAVTLVVSLTNLHCTVNLNKTFVEYDTHPTYIRNYEDIKCFGVSVMFITYRVLVLLCGMYVGAALLLRGPLSHCLWTVVAVIVVLLAGSLGLRGTIIFPALCALWALVAVFAAVSLWTCLGSDLHYASKAAIAVATACLPCAMGKYTHVKYVRMSDSATPDELTAISTA